MIEALPERGSYLSSLTAKTLDYVLTLPFSCVIAVGSHTVARD